jgi:hypothetical protein
LRLRRCPRHLRRAEYRGRRKDCDNQNYMSYAHGVCFHVISGRDCRIAEDSAHLPATAVNTRENSILLALQESPADQRIFRIEPKFHSQAFRSSEAPRHYVPRFAHHTWRTPQTGAYCQQSQF